jgi:hypothetical protein
VTGAADRVVCAMASPTDEDRTKHPDAVAYHQAHETLGECDAWVCRCGNQAHLDGFYPCDADGNEREVPDDTNLVFCGSCGVLISVETGEYVGWRPAGAASLGG